VEEELGFRLGGIKRRSYIRNSVRTMRKRNSEHHNRLQRTASHSPFLRAIRWLSIFGRSAQCAVCLIIFFSNVLHQTVKVVLFDGQVNNHGLGKYFRGKKLTRGRWASSLERRGSFYVASCDCKLRAGFFSVGSRAVTRRNHRATK
jgi:hypothetical protein